MTIRKKLNACLVGLALIIATLAGTAFFAMSNSNAGLDTIVNDRVVAMGDLKIVADEYAVSIVDASHKARSGEMSFPDALRQVDQGVATIAKHWDAYRATQLTEKELELAKLAENRMIAANGEIKVLQGILRTGDRAALQRFVENNLYASIDPVSGAIGNLIKLQIDVAKNTGTDKIAIAEFLGAVMLGLVTISIVVFIGALVTVRGQVVAPIVRLAGTIRGLAETRGEAEVPHLKQEDEIGDIARAVDTFRDAVVEAERDKARAASQATQILGEHLSSLATGDLTCTIDQELHEDFSQIRVDFNSAISELATTIGAVTNSVTQFRAGAGEVSQASDDLAQRTERQAASLEETSAAMRQLSDTVSQTAADAEKASTAVAEAQDDADKSGAIVKRTVAAMERLETMSAEISQIITVIDGIAFQTNLLALNAGVEAARAGDAGRGFAVVASEVRALALRSAEAAKDVKTRINASAGQVTESVGLVGETGSSLARIIDRIGQINTLIGHIATAATNQSEGISQISSAVTEMDGATQQNAAMVEEATAAARQLTSEANSLAGEIGKFNLANGSVASGPVHSNARGMRFAA